MGDATQRFSSRVDNYVKYRPGYPLEVVTTLQRAYGLAPSAKVADIGSGTGILTELLLRAGHTVYAVEPNREMRAAAERLLAPYPAVHHVAATAEATSLPDQSVDLVTVGQAFHWFDRPRARAEFARILRPGGWVALVWNDRDTASTPFLVAYENLLKRYATDYSQIDHKQITDAVLAEFFAPQPFRRHDFANRQDFDYAGIEGRLLSSSYAPEAGHPDHAPMLAELRRIFDTHQQEGQVAFLYATTLFVGRIST